MQAINDRVATELGDRRPELWDLSALGASTIAGADRYFPIDSQLIYIDRTLRSIGIDIDRLPIYFEFGSASSGESSAEVVVLDPDNTIRVFANLSDGLLSQRRLLCAVGEALFISSINQDERFFSTHIPPLYRAGMGELFALLVTDANWLTSQVGMPQSLAERLAGILRDRGLVTMRQQIVSVRFAMAVAETPTRAINELYWQHLSDLLSVPNHTELSCWFAWDPQLVPQPVASLDDLLASALAWQVIDYIYQEYGSLSDNPAVKPYLEQNFYRFGSRYPWTELIQRGTDRPFSARAILSALAR
jgi:DNA-binding transcriptional ArsR family regulator